MASALTVAEHASAIWWGSATAGGRYAFTDYIAQQQQHLSQEAPAEAEAGFEPPPFVFDAHRAACMALFGGSYTGGPGYLIYNRIYPSIAFFGTRPLAMAAFDVAVNCPFASTR